MPELAASPRLLVGGMAALSFGVYADLAFNAYSATNSSPQTTELFAGERSQTLWKYVVIGHGTVLGLGAWGSLLAGTWWPLIGSVTVSALMHGLYAHALKAGQGQTAPTG